jgi:hypothetical protein
VANSFGQSMARRVKSYLADFYYVFGGLRSRQGWFVFCTLGFILAGLVFWFILGLGFDWLNSAVGAKVSWRPRVCRTPDDKQSLVIVIGVLVFLMLAVVSLGEALRLLDRMNRGFPKQLKEVLIPTSGLTLVAIGGAIYMRIIC